MSTSHREIGVGYVNQQSDFSNVREDADNNCIAEDADAGPYFHYWAQNFGRRNDVYPLVINEEAAETANRDVSLYVYGVVWARDMRFRNENGSWSPWEPVATDKFWQLSPVSGTKTVEVELRNINNSVLAASDTIVLNLTCSAVDDQLDLPMQTVDYPQSFEACSLINALTGFELTEGGDVTFRAPRIHLGPGFIVRPGARFTAVSVTP